MNEITQRGSQGMMKLFLDELESNQYGGWQYEVLKDPVTGELQQLALFHNSGTQQSNLFALYVTSY